MRRVVALIVLAEAAHWCIREDIIFDVNPEGLADTPKFPGFNYADIADDVKNDRRKELIR
jgi:hypothetical protein